MGIRGVNKAQVIGNLGNDPELRMTANQIAVTNLSIATSESWKDKQSGEVRENTEWHKLVMYGGLAEIACKYLHKGSKIYIEGKLQTKEYDSKEGIKKSITEIVVSDMQMLDKKNTSSNENTQYGGSDSYKINQSTTQPERKQPTNFQNNFEDEDDIPF